MSKRFSVKETFHDYRLVDDVTGLEACMGDGVGQDFRDWDTLGDLLYHDYEGRMPVDDSVGTDAFREAWENDANENTGVYFGAYWAWLDTLVIYDNDETIDRYTVLIGPAPPLECHMQGEKDLWVCLGLSVNCDSPQGFSQWGFAVPNPRLGETVHFLDLPDNVQKHIAEKGEYREDEQA